MIKPIAKLWKLLENEVFPFESNQTLFNQFNTVEPDLDINNGHLIRRQNLKNYLNSISSKPEFIIIGEAPGHKGMRFTGVPFTNEEQLLKGILLPFEGRKTSLQKSPRSGLSANIFWETLRMHHPRFIVWDCILFHPHDLNKSLSNRRPKPEEIRKHSKILMKVLSLLDPITVIALGRKPEKMLDYLEYPNQYIRHPAHGGINDFKRGMENLFRAHS
jgi:uracil-DNA glycosylase